MNLIDMHCDTIWKMREHPEITSIHSDELSVNLSGLSQERSLVQFFACFLNSQKIVGDDLEQATWDYLESLLEIMHKQLKENCDAMAFAGNAKQVWCNSDHQKISALLTLEDGGVIAGKLDHIKCLYEKGIRLITLTWNHENCIGYPNSAHSQYMNRGLKPFGFEVIEEMNCRKMIVDVSHLSDGCFWDVIRHSKTPVIASHSNCRVLCNHPRNLTDGMLRAIGEQGGVIGVNFYPYFLTKSKHVTARQIVKHISHIVNVAGLDSAAIGSDFDGFEVDEYQTEIKRTGDMPILYDEMLRAGLLPSQCDKIWTYNAMRVIEEVL